MAKSIQRVVGASPQAGMPLRDNVQLKIVHAKLQVAVFLLDKDGRRCPGGHQLQNNAAGMHLHAFLYACSVSTNGGLDVGESGASFNLLICQYSVLLTRAR